jgi:hypothetical protein
MAKVPETLPKPLVSFAAYLPEEALLSLAWLTPMLVWRSWHDVHLLARSGSVMVLCSVLAEFIFLNRVNRKLLKNAKRVAQGQVPWNFSTAETSIGIAGTVLRAEH